jgi:hypothetical protein
MSERITIPLTPEQTTETPTLTVPLPLIHEPPPPPTVEPPVTEPIPAPPGVPEALPDIVSLAGLLAALGLILLISALTDWLNWLIRFMFGPLWRKVGSPTLTNKTLAQPLSNALGKAYAKIDADIGLSFYKLAGLTARASSAIVAGEQAAYVAATRLAALTGATRAHALNTGTALQQARQAAQAASQALTATAAAQAGAKQRAQGLDARLTALETHVTTLIEPELEGLRHLIPELEHGVTTAWDVLKQHGEALGIAALTASTATALARLGAGWVACEGGQVLGEAACRTGPNKLKSLLEGLFDIAALLDLCQLVSLIATAAESPEVTAVFTALTGGIQDLIDCRGIVVKTGLPRTRYVALPPVGSYAALTYSG